jgi:Flp pilus assembly pilin Flp
VDVTACTICTTTERYNARSGALETFLRRRTEMENLIVPTKRRKKSQSGVTVVEYAIMLALIAIAVAVAAPNITSAVVGVFSKASSVMNK